MGVWMLNVRSTNRPSIDPRWVSCSKVVVVETVAEINIV